jgi:hypothetical protein
MTSYGEIDDRLVLLPVSIIKSILHYFDSNIFFLELLSLGNCEIVVDL